LGEGVFMLFGAVRLERNLESGLHRFRGGGARPRSKLKILKPWPGAGGVRISAGRTPKGLKIPVAVFIFCFGVGVFMPFGAGRLERDLESDPRVNFKT